MGLLSKTNGICNLAFAIRKGIIIIIIIGDNNINNLCDHPFDYDHLAQRMHIFQPQWPSMPMLLRAHNT